MTLPGTASPAQPSITPVKVNLLRPKCFCGLTSVSIYPEPPAIVDNSESKILHKTNWVYECHYTPKQHGMVRPDPCEDCEDERRKRLVRAKETTSNTTSTGTVTKPPFRIRHRAEQIDQVELWPRSQPGPGITSTETITGTMFSGTGRLANTVPVGADLGRPATFNGLSSSDRNKVCGFHMHALEWHHMQTVGLDAILNLAKETECEEFNFSVVRWLGDKVSTNVTNNSDTISSSATTPSNTFGNRTNIYSNSIGLKLKLYANINCECGSDTVIAKGPTIPWPLFRPPSKERQFLIVCRKKAMLSHSLEIVESSLRDNHSGNHGHDYRASQVRLKANPTGKVGKCISSISIDSAVFWCHTRPIHQHIETNRWLSKWLSPPLQASQSAHASSRPRSTRSFPSPALRSISTSNTSVPELEPPIPHISTTHDFRRLGQSQSSMSTPPLSSLPYSTRRGSTKEQGRQISNSANDAVAGLEDLDWELEKTVAWHVAEVTSIMYAHDGPPSSVSVSTPDYLSPIAAEREYANYQEINIEKTYPSIAMHLCQQCKEYARDFCVVPLPKNPSGDPTAFSGSSIAHTGVTTSATSERSPPLSSPQSPQLHLLDTPIIHLTKWTPDTMVDMGQEALNRKLEMVDRKLEWVMERHARAFLETMKARSRLIPGLLLCRGCDYRATGRDVLPCCHTLVCNDCVDLLEFYLVPRASFWRSMV